MAHDAFVLLAGSVLVGSLPVAAPSWFGDGQSAGEPRPSGAFCSEATTLVAVSLGKIAAAQQSQKKRHRRRSVREGRVARACVL